MSDTMMKLDEFLAEAFNFYYEIAIAVNYANEISTLHALPIEIKVGTLTSAAKCKFIFDKYDKLLRMNPSDEGFEKLAYEVSKNLHGDSGMVYAFLHKLDLILMEYGAGPKFSKNHQLVTSPLET